MIPEKPITEYLEDLNRKNTKLTSLSSIRRFLSWIYKYDHKKKILTPEEEQQYEILAKRYLTEERDYKMDIIKYFQSSTFRNITMVMHLSILKTFLLKYKIELQDLPVIKKKMPKNYDSTNCVELDLDILRKILVHGDEKVRAVILVALSSGMRIGEILNLKYGNITPVEGKMCYKVRIVGDSMEKSGHGKITFITQEAMDAIDAWMEVRSRYLQNKRYLSHHPDVKRDSEYIFPFSKSLFNKIFTTAVKKAGLYEIDPVTGKATIHIHQLRGMFRTNMIVAGVPAALVEKFIHYSSSNAYNKFTTSQLADSYLKGMPSVTTNYDIQLKKDNELLQIVNTKLTKDLTVTREEYNQLAIQTANLLAKSGILGKILTGEISMPPEMSVKLVDKNRVEIPFR